MLQEFLRGAVQVHVLHHAAAGDVHGAWLAVELRRHGCDISTGTLYPMLHRMEETGLLVSRQELVEGGVDDVVPVLLVVLAVAFAWSMGAHYTGACIGMPHALKAVNALQALLLTAPLAWLGATVASHGVEHTVADRLTARPLGTGAEISAVGVAFALTTVFTQVEDPHLDHPDPGVRRRRPRRRGRRGLVDNRHPGDRVGLCAGRRRRPRPWSHPAPRPGPRLATRQVPASRRPRPLVGHAQESGAGRRRNDRGPLIIVGAAASFVMGSNDVANATGSLVATRTFSPLVAGVLGGGGLALGVLTWGRPLLRRVAFDIVKLDRPMATAAQAVVVITAVGFGLFTSMNQALIGAMAGAGAARGRDTVNRPVLVGIVRGWVIGPGAGIAAAYLVARIATAVAGRGALG